MNEVVQNAETVGTALKTISARIRGTASDLGDETDELVITTSKLRKEIKALTKVDIMDGSSYKSTYQILKEIAEVYDTLDNTSQSRVNELLGGKVGINTIQAILTNFDTAKQIVEELDTGLAKGSATKELEKSLDSIQGKLNQLKSTWQQFSTDFLDTGIVKGAVDGLKGLISVVDSLTKHIKSLGAIYASVFAGIVANKAVKKTIGGSILGIGTTGLATNRRYLDFLTGIQAEKLPGYSRTEMDINAIKQAKANGDDLNNLTQLSAQMKEYAKNTEAADMSVAHFYATQTKSAQGFLGSIQAIKTYNKMGSEQQRLAFADAVAISNKELGNQMKQLRGANASATIYFKTLKIGVKELGAKVFSGITTGLVNMVASLAIGALIQGIKWLSESYDRMLEKNAELSRSLKETTDEIKNQEDGINSLMSQYANIVVTTSDLSTAQSQLIDIQEELADALGVEKDQLDLVNDSYANNIKLIQERRKKMADEFTEETKNINQYNDAKKYLEESSVAHWEAGFNGGQRLRKEGNYSAIEASGYGDWDDDTKAFGVMNKHKNISYSQYRNTLYVEGTVDEQIETLESLNKELTKLWGNKPSSANEHKWLKNLQERIDTLKEEKKAAEELIAKFDELKKINKIDSKAYSDIEKIEKVVEKLQSANNAKDIIEASNSYKQLKEEIYGAVGESDTATRDLLDTYFEAIEKNIDQGILDINNNVTILEKVLKKFQDETYEKFTGKLSKLDSAIQTISAGDSIDESSINELIKMDALALEDFQKTTDGYTISLENLISVREKYIKEQKDDIRDTLEEENQLYEDQLAQIKQLETELSTPKKIGYDKTGQAIYSTDDVATENRLNELKKAAEETQERIKAWTAYDKMISEDIAELQDEIYEKINSKVGKIDSAIKTLSSGEYLDASTLLELGKIDSTLLGKFKESVEGYTLSLDSLYSIRKKLIKAQGDDIKNEIEYTKNLIREQEAIIAAHDKTVYDKTGQRVYSDDERYGRAKSEKKEAEERLTYLEALYELLGKNTDAVSLFQQAVSETKGFKDDITSLYSTDGLDDQFFVDHPELVKYKNDVEKLYGEIQKLSNAKAAPVLEQLKELLAEAQKNGDKDAVAKYSGMIEVLRKSADLSNTKALEEQKKKLREQIEAKERYIKGLERQRDKEQKILDALNKQKEALEKIASDYETAAKTAQDYVDEQIDALDKQTEALEENKKAIEEDYDARIKAIEDAIAAIEAEADALEKQSEAQERLNELKEKELALEEAKRKKVRVYDATRGWRIEEDSDAVAQAEKEYKEALKNYNKYKLKEQQDARKAELQAQIDALNKEKEAALEAIDKQIERIEAMKKEWEEYKKLWDDALNAYQKLQDEMAAAAILGSDWREKIAQKDLGIINTFQENYTNVQNQLHGVVEKQIEDVQKVIDKYDEQIQVQNDLKSAQESYLGYYETYSKKFESLTDAQTAALNRLNAAIASGNPDAALDAVLEADNAFAATAKGVQSVVQQGANSTPSSKIQQLLMAGQNAIVEKFMKTAPNTFAEKINNMFTGILPPILNKVLAENIKNNTQKSVNDNRSVVFNNAQFDATGTYEKFKEYMNRLFNDLDKDAKVGR